MPTFQAYGWEVSLLALMDAAHLRYWSETLMNHTAIVNGLSQFEAPIQYTKNNNAAIPFFLGEVGNSLNPGSNNYDLEGVLGSALWTVDYMLYAMSIVGLSTLPH